MYVRNSLFKAVSATLIGGLISASAFATQVELELAINWNAEVAQSGPVAELVTAMSSTSDTWTVTLDLTDFNLTQPAGADLAHIVQEANNEFAMNVVSTSALPIGIAPAIPHDGFYSDDYAQLIYNNVEIESLGGISLEDRVEDDHDVAPTFRWRFTRSINNILPGMDAITDEDIISALSRPGATIGVTEDFYLYREAAVTKNGSAQIVSVSVDGVAVEADPATCTLEIVSEWQNGFVGLIRVKNDSNTAINGWDMDIDFTTPVEISNSWSTTLNGSAGSFNAADLGWNALIQPGQEINFGFQGSKEVGQPATAAAITGSTCK